MTIPLVDLHAQYQTIRSEIDTAIADVIRTSAFIHGPYVEAFEDAYASAYGARHCISCANGTDALYIALRGLGAGPGDEIITTAHSWISTSESITHTGAQVVFCDTTPDTFTVDPARLQDRITVRTRGIVVVHLFGQPADMQAIMDIAGKHQLWVLEDCAQAHGARYRGQLVGTFGRAATFSFYPGKNLGAMGDGGCILTNEDALAKFVRLFARHGALVKGDHEIEGINSRLDGLQAAILLAKMRHLTSWTAVRRRLAAVYDRALCDVGDVVTPAVGLNREHVYHLYVIRTSRRDKLRDALKRAGIDTAIHYPTALPFLRPYAYLQHRPSDFPVAGANQSQMLSLPMYPELADSMQALVVDTIRAFFVAAHGSAMPDRSHATSPGAM
jgi:dTDP-4-amino-4,6-dideoxygalactose transaminase